MSEMRDGDISCDECLQAAPPGSVYVRRGRELETETEMRERSGGGAGGGRVEQPTAAGLGYSGRRRQRRQTRHAAARTGAVCIGVRVLPGATPHMCRYPSQPLPLPRRRLRQDALTEPARSRHGR